MPVFAHAADWLEIAVLAPAFVVFGLAAVRQWRDRGAETGPTSKGVLHGQRKNR